MSNNWYSLLRFHIRLHEQERESYTKEGMGQGSYNLRDKEYDQLSIDSATIADY